jgi:hypothetical protein
MERATSTTNDLVFGEGGFVTVIDGARQLAKLPAEDARLEVYGIGDLEPAQLRAALREDDFSDCFGRFVVLVFDRAQQVLTVFNDRYGQQPFFVARCGERFVMSTRIATLLDSGRVPRSLSRSALADVLVFDVPLERRTLVEGIESIPAATRLRFDLASRTLDEKQQWNPAALLREPARPFAETESALFEAFMEGFDACVRGKRIGITLSGGIDSRCLLAAALHCGSSSSVACFNSSIEGTRSSVYSRRMAGMAQARYEQHPVGLDFAKSYAERIRKVLALSEGMSFSSEVEAQWLSERIGGVDVVLHGAFAELSKLDSMHVYNVDAATAQATRETLGDVLWRRFQRGRERSLAAFAPALRDEVSEAARTQLDARLAKVDAALSVEQTLQVLYIEEFLGKVTKCSAAVWNDRIPTRFPFAGPRYVDLLLRTRGADRIRQLFQMALLKRTSPALFRHPDANTGLRVDAPELANTAVEFIDRVRRFLVARKTTQDHSDQKYWVANMSEAPESVLLEGSGRALFDESATQRLLATLRAPAAPTRNPMTQVRRRMDQHAAGISIAKALMLQFWLDQMRVRA